MNFNQICVYFVNSWNGILSYATSVVQPQCLSILSIHIAGFSVYDVAEGGCDIGMTTPVPFWGRFESAGR